MKAGIVILIVIAWAVWAGMTVHMDSSSLYCQTGMDKYSLAKCK